MKKWVRWVALRLGALLLPGVCAAAGSGRRRCSLCGSKTLVCVPYGMPTPVGFESADRGEIVQGGCVSGPGAPAYWCTSCGKRLAGSNTCNTAVRA